MPSKTPLQVWLEQVKEDTVDPDLAIVDPHHHLTDALHEPRGSVSFGAKMASVLPYKASEAIFKIAFPKPTLDAFHVRTPVAFRYLADELVADFGGHNVQKTVAIQMNWEDHKEKVPEFSCVSESEKFFADIQARREKLGGGFPQACVAHINLNLGKDRVAAAIKRHMEVNPYTVGVRHMLAFHPTQDVWHPDEAAFEMSKRENFRSGMQAVQEAGWSFDLYCFHPQLLEMVELVKAFPKVQFILDHAGTPLGVGPYAGADGKERAWREWQDGMAAVAACPNVVVKLSGMTMPITGLGFEGRATGPPTSDELAEATKRYYVKCIELFGVDRCMFASNFPVDKVSCSYVVLFNSFKKIARDFGLSDADKDKVFRTTAERVYKLRAEKQAPRSQVNVLANTAI